MLLKTRRGITDDESTSASGEGAVGQLSGNGELGDYCERRASPPLAEWIVDVRKYTST